VIADVDRCGWDGLVVVIQVELPVLLWVRLFLQRYAVVLVCRFDRCITECAFRSMGVQGRDAAAMCLTDGNGDSSHRRLFRNAL